MMVVTQETEFLTLMSETWIEFLDPGFVMAHFWLLQHSDSDLTDVTSFFASASYKNSWQVCVLKILHIV